MLKHKALVEFCIQQQNCMIAQAIVICIKQTTLVLQIFKQIRPGIIGPQMVDGNH